MEHLSLEIAQSMIRKTWTESIGKNPTKRHFTKVINTFFSSRKNVKDELFNMLKPFIKREKKISEISVNDLCIKTDEEENRQLLRKKLEKNRGNYIPWENNY